MLIDDPLVDVAVDERTSSAPASFDTRRLERSDTSPIIARMTRLSSSETIRTNSKASIDNPSSIENYSQENRDAAVGHWYEEEGWEDEDINYNDFWDDYHHLDVQVCLTEFISFL